MSPFTESWIPLGMLVNDTSCNIWNQEKHHRFELWTRVILFSKTLKFSQEKTSKNKILWKRNMRSSKIFYLLKWKFQKPTNYSTDLCWSLARQRLQDSNWRQVFYWNLKLAKKLPLWGSRNCVKIWWTRTNCFQRKTPKMAIKLNNLRKHLFSWFFHFSRK